MDVFAALIVVGGIVSGRWPSWFPFLFRRQIRPAFSCRRSEPRRVRAKGFPSFRLTLCSREPSPVARPLDPMALLDPDRPQRMWPRQPKGDDP